MYVDESERGPRPITGASTSTAGFLGETLRGPEDSRLVTSFAEFTALYGGYVPPDESALPFAVDGFFMNGGRRCFIARIVAHDAVAMTALHDGKIRLSAIARGTWGNRIAAAIDLGSLKETGQPGRFKLTVMYWDQAPPIPIVDPTDPTQSTDPNRREPTLLETHDNLSADPASIDFFETRINSSSSLLRVHVTEPGAPALLSLTMLVGLGTSGTDGSSVDIRDYLGGELPPPPGGTVYSSGLKGFEQVDEISVVCAPSHHAVPALAAELITHCTRMGDRFAVLHSNPVTDTPASIDDIRPPQDTSLAAFYFPWIKIFNPLTNQDSEIPPSGHIAGIYAKTDIERGVFKAPANEVVVGAKSVGVYVTEREQELLSMRGVNCIRAFPTLGIRVFGAHTSSTNSLWKYINVRRLLLFLEKSIEKGTQWAVFEQNDDKLWILVKQSITDFLTTEWRNGALMGTKAEDAFFVKVDRTTMTQDDIDNGRLICVIGVAPIKPAEFVIFRIAQWCIPS